MAGDGPTRQLNVLQRIFAWLFGSTVAVQAFEGDNVLDSIKGAREAFEPLRSTMDWASGNIWLLAAMGCIGIIAFIRLLRAEHVKAYQNFDYQGPPKGPAPIAKTETLP